jgi:hypothetical protein
MPKPTLSLRLNEFTEKKLRRPGRSSETLIFSTWKHTPSRRFMVSGGLKARDVIAQGKRSAALGERSK